MRYQLVVQFSDSLLSYDSLIVMEDKLIETLANNADIDGHDLGAGEINIFILTNTPEETFSTVINVIEKKISKEQYRVAYREIETDDYTILWPSTLAKFTVA
jgi:hypothetical protein